MSLPFIEENDQTIVRRAHLEALRELVGNVYPNKFTRSEVVETGREDTISTVFEKFRGFAPPVAEGRRPSPEELELANSQLNHFTVRLAGRLATPPRDMGKAAFVHLSDGVSRLQLYIRRDDVVGVHNDQLGGEVDGWKMFQLLDHGDFVGVEGFLFVTKTGELSVHVQKLQFLAKALLPLPDKMHGVNDPEIRQRQQRLREELQLPHVHRKLSGLGDKEKAVDADEVAVVQILKQFPAVDVTAELVVAHAGDVVTANVELNA